MDIRTIILTALGLQAIAENVVLAETNNHLRHNEDKAPTSVPSISPTYQPTIDAGPFERVYAYSVGTGNKAAAKINQARRGNLKPTPVRMRMVFWNPKLAADLAATVAKQTQGMMFTKVPLPGPNHGKASFYGFHLMELSGLNAKYPNYTFLIHDTFHKPQLLLANFGERLRQGTKCIKFTLCSPNNATYFETCGHPLQLFPGSECSWSTQYFPILMDEQVDEFACVGFETKGPSAPPGQPWSYFCYARFKRLSDAANFYPNNDIPYLGGGARCSKCPADALVCVNGLCAPKIAPTGRMLLNA